MCSNFREISCRKLASHVALKYFCIRASTCCHVDGFLYCTTGFQGQKHTQKRKIMTNRCSLTLCVFCLRRNFEGEKFRFFFIRNLLYRIYFRTFTKHINLTRYSWKKFWHWLFFRTIISKPTEITEPWLHTIFFAVAAQLCLTCTCSLHHSFGIYWNVLRKLVPLVLLYCCSFWCFQLQ